MDAPLNFIYQHKLIAVIRGASTDNIAAITQALYDGGVKILEITAETPQVLDVIRHAIAHANDDILIGAGTVLDESTARAMLMAGAQFICSPTVDHGTIKTTKRYGAVSIPGAMTPTEVLSAFESGGDIIKVFPANVLGPGFIKSVHGPLPHIPMMPTGGINVDNIQPYIDSGAVAIGLGGSLIKTEKCSNRAELEKLTDTAAQFSKII